MKGSWHSRPKVLVVFVLSLLFLHPGCQRRAKEEAPTHPEASWDAQKIAVQFGIPVYPASEIVDKSVKSTRVRVPGSENANLFTETIVANIWMATTDSVGRVKAYYQPQNRYVITEEKDNESPVFLQLASVPDIDKALAQKVATLTLVNIRKMRLTEAERGAYTNEVALLRSVKSPDLIQKRRLEEVERLLAEKTFVQYNVRRTNS